MKPWETGAPENWRENRNQDSKQKKQVEIFKIKQEMIIQSPCGWLFLSVVPLLQRTGLCPGGKGFTGVELVDLAGLAIWNNGSGQS